ncbi:DnaJ domain-containing protein [Phenylobacterium montanum]|uniref:DnaJ domain-containing protein n=2 Tax=Phenylobacterium montanum TaxID=2823693 RepID=A0A975FVD7_9CAUL|nr:DnaJ domain-containing protein [Caulobacter sp. S6]
MEISPNANSETVERMFRYLARRYHPDNQATADRDRFDLILEAHKTLRDPERRVQYDLEYRNHSNFRFELAEEASSGDGVVRDIDIQAQLLSLFYAKRRKDSKDPGMGDGELGQILGCPIEHLEFNLWYMKEKGWISRTENGTFAITAAGVDRAASESQTKAEKKLLTDQS